MGVAKKTITKAAGLLSCLLLPLQALAVTIDTTPGWTGGGYNFCTDCYYGQVFTVPTTENVLDSFTFFLSGSDPIISFIAAIVPWNSETFSSGSILYSSEVRNNAGFPLYNGTRSGYATVTFVPIHELTLTPDKQYVAYLKTEPGPQWAAIGHNFNVDSYTGGYHLFGSPPDRWYGISGNDMRDYAFQASFTTPQSVPEPSSILGIMAIGLLELKLLLLYKRNKRVPNTRLTAPPPVM